MASVVYCLRAKFNALDAANFPGGERTNLFFGESPLVLQQAQVFPPYNVLTDRGTTADYEFEHYVVEVTEFTLDVFADTLEDVDTTVNAVKYNGGGVTGGLGFDFGTLPGLDAGARLMEVRRTREVRSMAGVGLNNQRVHRCEVSYRVTVQRN